MILKIRKHPSSSFADHHRSAGSRAHLLYQLSREDERTRYTIWRQPREEFLHGCPDESEKHLRVKLRLENFPQETDRLGLLGLERLLLKEWWVDRWGASGFQAGGRISREYQALEDACHRSSLFETPVEDLVRGQRVQMKVIGDCTSSVWILCWTSWQSIGSQPATTADS